MIMKREAKLKDALLEGEEKMSNSIMEKSNKPRKYARPIDMEPSRFVHKYVSSLYNLQRPVIDVACGYGRNGLEILKGGNRCVFCDVDIKCLKEIITSIQFTNYRDNYCLKRIDFDKEKWPFPDNSCAGIINVHYYNHRLIPFFMRSICKGGFLLIETIDNRGDNYLELTKSKYLFDLLKSGFDFIYYSEGKIIHGRAKVKLFAIKK